ncbi:hypothetical protein [Paractinoplanes atraurantiacus]|uniref:Phage protein, HK97 gp10 family n=1 Tax=Paractinoplanes atraurantiacus TaxID=1036182 RepID=A0A285H3J1_9ACTN|nr:hypothetical protein [Actinoplanes atraurantiacus]SNY29061.1 hypothetical protein SAMN05421748_103185 [Actinoplanes atraurantiacus]
MIGVETDGQALKKVARALRDEEDGKALARDLGKSIRKALEPAVIEARAGIMGMPSMGLPVEGQPLRQAISRRIKAQARLSGRAPGARVRVTKKGMPRGFELAARRTNRRKGWRHPVHGNTEKWVQQIGQPGWFDDPMRRGRPRYRAAVLTAMNEAARRITRKV